MSNDIVFNDAPKAVKSRLPKYLNFLKSLRTDKLEYISAPVIADALGLGYMQVRKDLAYATKSGKPKVGYNVHMLIRDLEFYLGYNKSDDVLLVGAGKLGKALLDYKGFSEYGLNIAAAFDTVASSGITKNGKYIYPIGEFPAICKSLDSKIGIICVGEGSAQEVSDLMVKNGIKAIMNFAPVHLSVPPDVTVMSVNIAAQLALLAKNSNEH